MALPSSETGRIEVPLSPDRHASAALGKLLFQIPGPTLARVLGELSGLTGKTPSFAWIGDEDSAAFIVDSPPTVWLGRRIEESSNSANTRIFREWAAGVWIQIGYSPQTALPAAFAIRKSARHILIRYPGELLRLGDFPDSAVQIEIQPSTEIRDSAAPPRRFRIKPKFVKRESTTLPTLWIITEDALSRLSSYCRGSHEQALGILEVAVTQADGKPLAIVRTSRTSRVPPIFTVDASAYTPWNKQNNLFLPNGRRLSPLLRRDIWLAALNLNRDRLYWVNCHEGAWRIESLPEEAFEPISHWVEYSKSAEAIRRDVWEQSADWTPAPFLERPEKRPEPRIRTEVIESPTLKAPRRGIFGRAIQWIKSPRSGDLPPKSSRPEVPFDEPGETPQKKSDRLHHARPESMGVGDNRLQHLENSFFRKIANPEADLSSSWAELAAAYENGEKSADAAMCWMNAAWSDRHAPGSFFWGWLKATSRECQTDPRFADPAGWLDGASSPAKTRALAAWVVWASRQTPTPEALTRLTVRLQDHLRIHEHWLPVKAAWLAQSALAKFNRGDVLGLARTRDRLAERLLDSGLSLELDTPPFLRFGDDESRLRHHEATRWLEEKRRTIQRWITSQSAKTTFSSSHEAQSIVLLENGLEPERSNTLRYADLLIGWGLLRLSESLRAEEIIKQADDGFPHTDPVHGLLRSAFEHRFRNMREGRPAKLPLPSDWRERRNQLPGVDRYFADKFCENSRVLQPNPPPSAYLEAVFQKAVQTAPTAFALNRLNSARLNEMLPELLEKELKGRGATIELARLVGNALRRITELRPECMESLIAIIPTAMDGARSSPIDWAMLTENGLAAASYADRPELARFFVRELLAPLANSGGYLDLPESLTSQAFRCLRRMGLRTEADRVLHHLAANITQGLPLAKIRKSRPVEWPTLLRTMLHVAAGWYYSGRDEQAFAVLEEAKTDLFDPETSPVNRTRLALAYAQTLGQAPLRVAMGRLDELFQRLNGLHLRGSANRYFCIPMIQLVESTVRAVVADELASGAAVRTWLDADEFSVRRRIRDDLSDAFKSQGLSLTGPEPNH